MKEIKLYSPIEVTAYEGDNTYPTPINGVPYAKKIAESINVMDTAAGDRGLMVFFDRETYPNINNKVNSIHFSVIYRDTEMYCETTIEVNDDCSLNKNEINRISDFVTGQFSDCIGEVLVQTPCIADDGEIYAHLWQDSNWNLMTQTEFNKLSHFKETIHKPDAPMINSDSNIFNQLSIAKKALVDNGQDYVAKEMVKRAMESESYDEALRVISEYINPVDKHYYIKPRGKNNDFKDR